MLYCIGDTHLSFNDDKKMDKFPGWEYYEEQLEYHLSALKDDDTLVICGDVSWAMSLAGTAKDFAWLNAFPGNKILLKGNHDYWWQTKRKMDAFLQEHGFNTLRFLHNNAYLVGGIAVCGTRGWFYEEPGDDKVLMREVGRLKASLSAGREMCASAELVAFLHYPPVCVGYECPEVLDVLQEYGVTRCFYGHMHGKNRKSAVEGIHRGIDFKLVSADHLCFAPTPVGTAES